jgi:hypothetical protein
MRAITVLRVALPAVVIAPTAWFWFPWVRWPSLPHRRPQYGRPRRWARQSRHEPSAATAQPLAWPFTSGPSCWMTTALAAFPPQSPAPVPLARDGGGGERTPAP